MKMSHSYEARLEASRDFLIAHLRGRVQERLHSLSATAAARIVDESWHHIVAGGFKSILCERGASKVEPQLEIVARMLADEISNIVEAA